MAQKIPDNTKSATCMCEFNQDWGGGRMMGKFLQ